jgi:hypothetical protein
MKTVKRKKYKRNLIVLNINAGKMDAVESQNMDLFYVVNINVEWTDVAKFIVLEVIIVHTIRAIAQSAMVIVKIHLHQDMFQVMNTILTVRIAINVLLPNVKRNQFKIPSFAIITEIVIKIMYALILYADFK